MSLFRKEGKLIMGLIKAKFIGIGAAGNKAVLALKKAGIVADKDILLINTTNRDIPDEEKEDAIIFGNIRGCGKERKLAQKMMGMAFQQNVVNIQNFIYDEDDKEDSKETQTVIIATSVEGGTGSGSSIILAKFISTVMKVHVHLFAFCGFEDDIRGIKNTVDWFKELEAGWTVEAISNKKFLAPGVDREQAESLANAEFVRRMKTLIGHDIKPSSANMDERDLFKVATRPGFMTIESAQLKNIKDENFFNQAIKDMAANSKSLVTEPSAIIMGIMLNASTKTQALIDENFAVLNDIYGKPYERFYHRQSTHPSDYIEVIVSGSDIPYDYVNSMYERFSKEMTDIDSRTDVFFNQSFDTDSADVFDTGNDIAEYSKPAKRAIDESEKASFLESLGLPKTKQADPFVNKRPLTRDQY